MKKGLTLFVLILLGLTNNAYAEKGRAYGQVSLFGVFLEDSEFTVIAGGNSYNGKITTDFGSGFSLSAGYAGANGFRMEGEFAFRRNKEESATVSSSDQSITFDSSGDYESLAFMINALYDWKFDSKLQPYIGGGIGIVRVGDGDYDDNVFGYQILVGWNYHISHNFALVLGYRQFGTQAANYTVENIRLEDVPYLTYNIEIGFRAKF